MTMNDIGKLTKIILEDKNKSGSYDRYPIRFLFMNIEKDVDSKIYALYSDLAAKRKTSENQINEIKLIDLSKYLNFDDAWLTKTAVLNALKRLDPNFDYIILGFSELVRFYSKKELEPLIISMMTDIENTGRKNKQRIYIVCFSLYEKIQEELRTNRRNESIDPILKIDEDIVEVNDKICVYYANSSFDSSIFTNKIKTTKEWLSLYKARNLKYDEGIVCVSDTLVDLYEKAKPDNFVALEKVDNNYKLLTLMYKMELNYASQDSFTEDYWKALFDSCLNKGIHSIKDLVSDLFNVTKIDEDNILELFDKANLFGKKTLHLYMMEHGSSILYGEYLLSILDYSKLSNYKNVKEALLTRFNVNNDKLYFNGRKYYVSKVDGSENNDGLIVSAINALYRNFLQSRIYGHDLTNENLWTLDIATLAQSVRFSEERIRQIISEFYREYLCYILTGSQAEKELLILLIQQNIISLSDCKSLYPELIAYLGNKKSVYLRDHVQWIQNYLYEYKLAKLFNVYGDQVTSLTKENSKSFPDWYISSELKYPLDSIVKGKDYDVLAVLDGVGSEYLDFLFYLCTKYGKSIRFADYCKCFLPSITSVNKAHYDGQFDEWIGDFDQNYIHDTFYKSEKCIAKALTLIEEIFEELINKYSAKRIAIIADHGSTAAGKISKPSKKYNYKQAEHEGRCALLKDNENVPESEDYEVFETPSGDRWILATREVSLNDNPKREAHGGATIEEAVVPCLIIGEKTEDSTINHELNIISGTLSGLNRKVDVEILPHLEEPPLLRESNGVLHTMVLTENNVWRSEIDLIRTQEVTVMINGKNYTLMLKGSMGASLIGGDGFDD